MVRNGEDQTALCCWARMVGQEWSRQRPPGLYGDLSHGQRTMSGEAALHAQPSQSTAEFCCWQDACRLRQSVAGACGLGALSVGISTSGNPGSDTPAMKSVQERAVCQLRFPQKAGSQGAHPSSCCENGMRS